MEADTIIFCISFLSLDDWSVLISHTRNVSEYKVRSYHLVNYLKFILKVHSPVGKLEAVGVVGLQSVLLMEWIINYLHGLKFEPTLHQHKSGEVGVGTPNQCN